MDPNRSYNLSQFMEEIIPTERSGDAFFKSPVADKIHDVVGHEYLTEPIVATFFWQIITYSSYYDNFFSQYANKLVKEKIKPQVVSHGSNQYSLLVLMPGLPKDNHYVLRVNEISSAEIQEAFLKWAKKNQEALGRLERFLTQNKLITDEQLKNFRTQIDLFLSVHPDFIDSILRNIPMNIVFNLAPEEEMTSNSFKSNSYHKVTSNVGETSTAGVYCFKQMKVNGADKEVFGVTVCRHGLTGELKPSQFVSNLYGQEVEVDGIKGRILSDDLVSDSCFVELDQSKINGITDCAGPLQILPDPNRSLSFEGATSGKKSTKIYPLAWDNDILTPELEVQKLISTPKVTNKGDSGAGLFDENGNIIGFSFSKTKLGSQPEFSRWVWANSVFQFHNLKT